MIVSRPPLPHVRRSCMTVCVCVFLLCWELLRDAVRLSFFFQAEKEASARRCDAKHTQLLSAIDLQMSLR